MEWAQASFLTIHSVAIRSRLPSKPDWIKLRDRWEWSHAVRAALGLLAFILLVTAVAL
jgi:hypothetical protein